MRIIGISGTSSSGKTLLIEELTKYFSSKGYSVATIKCSKHEQFDIIGKDTLRHRIAGACYTIGLAEKETILLTKKISLFDAINLLLPPVDYVFVEGCDKEKLPRIVVGNNSSKAFANWKPGEKIDEIINKINSLPKETTHLIIDDKKIPMNYFVQKIFFKILHSLASTLKNVDIEKANSLIIKINLKEKFE
ncbi:MAG: molybdopterin-guanine dinucleotide biosynthesis protein B [Candidatus Ratteibacteria bacterium]